jgi:hypothetical protein
MRKLFMACALAGVTAVPASATTFVRMSDEALVDASEAAAVVRIESRAAAPDGQTAVVYRVTVEEALKGALPQELEVRVHGGGSGPIRLKIHGAPSFGVGERALVFLKSRGDGSYRIPQLFLGAFREVRAGERSLAVRNLSEVREARLTADGDIAISEPEIDPVRDFSDFAGWVRARARGEAGPKYLVEGAEAEEMRAATAEFTLFEQEDPDTGLVHKLRWFTFDNAGSVQWRARQSGQPGVAGGGFSEFQAALSAWNNDAQTPVDYRYAGTTSTTNSLCDVSEFDNVNAIVFNNPTGCEDLIDTPFSCSSGGILAVGGPWFGGEDDPPRTFQGETYWPIVAADIVTNSNIGCFFADSPAPAQAARELFAHELGHTLGIAHACGDSFSPTCGNNPTQDDALMRAFVHDDGRGAKLNSDDRNAVRALYRQNSNNLPAAPTSLTATAASTTQINLTWTDNSTNETEFRVEAKALGAAAFQDIGSAPANSTSAQITNLAVATQYTFRVRARNANGDSAYSNEATATTLGQATACVANDTTMCLANNRYRITLNWKTGDGTTGPGHVAPAGTPDSGIFWFFDPSNWELLIKVLDGCAVNQRKWVFFAATTNVEYVVTVVDTTTGAARQYLNPLGSAAVSVSDTNAFATCP